MMTTQVLIGALAEVTGFVATLALVITTINSYAKLPPKITIHFSELGRPHGSGPRGFALLTPIIVVAMFVTLTYFNPALGFTPHALGGTVRSATTLTVAFAGLLVLLSILGRAIIVYNLGESVGNSMPRIAVVFILSAIAVALAVIFAVLGIS